MIKQFFIAFIAVASATAFGASPSHDAETNALQKLLKQAGFTGKIEATLERKLGRPIDKNKAEVGRLIFFDKGLGLHKSNSCAGCHSPTAGFGDTQSIAIGIQSKNDLVGPDRSGPRNQRRTPTIANVAFYPVLMWNGRFSAVSGDPFDNRKGFLFPDPEATTSFPIGDNRFKHLLVAQAHVPFTEMPEMAGFTGAAATGLPLCQFVLPRSAPSPLRSADRMAPNAITTQRQRLFSAPADAPDFCQFDDGQGTALPRKFPDTDYLNSPIRHTVLREINLIEGYRNHFALLYPTVKSGNGIEFWMIGEVLAEFQISQTYANAPIDKFARGDVTALTPAVKRGAILFFGRAQCVTCHAVKGQSNEMFSDFKMHGAGVPQLAPIFGKDTGNVPFRNSNGAQTATGNHDLGLWEFTGNDVDRYKFRTSPLRNVALQPAYFHNGAFTRLIDAVRYHTNTVRLSNSYDPKVAGVSADLARNIGPIEPVISQLSPRLAKPLAITEAELSDLVSFLADGLLDSRAKPENLMKLIPASVPSGVKLQQFQKP